MNIYWFLCHKERHFLMPVAYVLHKTSVWASAEIFPGGAI